MGDQYSLFQFLKSRLCQLPCVHVFKTSRRWGQVGEQHGVICDIKSHVVSLYYYLFVFLCLKTIVVNAKGSDFNSHSENVWFSEN